MSIVSKALILLAFIVGGVVLSYSLRGDRSEASVEPMGSVRIAALDLDVGTFLDDADAPFVERPLSEIDAELVDGEEQDVLGAVVIAHVRAGEPVPRAALLLPGQEGFLAAVLRPGMRAASIAVDAVTGNAGHIFPGDRIDVLLTQHVEGAAAEDDPGRAWASETILSNVRVIAVDQDLREDFANREAGEVARTVTLELSPRDAERVAVARNLGALSLTLRSLLVEDSEGRLAVENGVDQDPAPTWARDISAVSRVARGEPEQVAADEPPAPPPARSIMVLRGGDATEVEQ